MDEPRDVDPAERALPEGSNFHRDGEHLHLCIPVTGVIRITIHGDGGDKDPGIGFGQAAWAEVIANALTEGLISIQCVDATPFDLRQPGMYPESHLEMSRLLSKLLDEGAIEVVLVTPEAYAEFGISPEQSG